MVEKFPRGGVLVRAGSEYGPSGEGHVRISFAAQMMILFERDYADLARWSQRFLCKPVL